jgi:pimeloyl-ACP methyl ester carboxylesterase
MPIVKANGIDIAYEMHGPDDGPVVLLIMGLGGQLAMWPAAFVDDLVGAGYRVVRFDNRDIGLSTKFEGERTPPIVPQMLLRRIGVKLKTPYHVADMADDAAALMEALDIDSAHVVGVSMGGMIGQFLAANHPARVTSFTAIMSSTGNPKLPRPQREVLNALLRRGPPPATREDIIDQTVAAFTVIGTPGEDQNTNGMRDIIATCVDRDHTPSGRVRQTAAIVAAGDFRHVTRRVAAPTMVIHGSADPLVSPEGGRDIAQTVPNARFEIIDGMGHDLPPRFLPRITELVLGHLEPT